LAFCCCTRCWASSTSPFSFTMRWWERSSNLFASTHQGEEELAFSRNTTTIYDLKYVWKTFPKTLSAHFRISTK
jgi:hypothetical protein